MAGAILALFTLALAPVMAIAAPVTMGSHCNSGTVASEAPLTNSCFMHCQIIQCRVSTAVESRAANLSRPIDENLLPVCLNVQPTLESATPCSKAIPPDPAHEPPPLREIIYQCRNSLSSEDPASL